MPSLIPVSTPSARAAWAASHISVSVYLPSSLATVLDDVADVSPVDARFLHLAHQGVACVAALTAAGAQHAKQLRDPFLVWTKIGHGEAPSERDVVVQDLARCGASRRDRLAWRLVERARLGRRDRAHVDGFLLRVGFSVVVVPERKVPVPGQSNNRCRSPTPCSGCECSYSSSKTDRRFRIAARRSRIFHFQKWRRSFPAAVRRADLRA